MCVFACVCMSLDMEEHIATICKDGGALRGAVRRVQGGSALCREQSSGLISLKIESIIF